MNDESSKTHHVPRSKVIARAAKQEAPDKLAVCLGLAFLFHFVPYLYLDLTFCIYINILLRSSSPSFLLSVSTLDFLVV
jgi:hypothetical protein